MGIGFDRVGNVGLFTTRGSTLGGKGMAIEAYGGGGWFFASYPGSGIAEVAGRGGLVGVAVGKPLSLGMEMLGDSNRNLTGAELSFGSGAYAAVYAYETKANYAYMNLVDWLCGSR